MPENGFLYIYVSNHSIQKVDFDHLSIIHQQGRVVEENHYYPYGMLIEGLSYVSNNSNPSKYKFNGISYETSNDLYNYMAPFRSYDPSIAKWNQLDPMNQFQNGYIAFGGNPVLLVDPLGLSANYGSSKSDFATMDAISPRDNRGKNGGCPGGIGFTSAEGVEYSSSELHSYFENMRFYNSLPDEVKDALGTDAAGFAGGIHNGDVSVNIATTTSQIFAYSSATYLGSDNNPQWRNDGVVSYFSSTHFYSIANYLYYFIY